MTRLSSGKIDKYEYLTGEEILPSEQSRMTEQANFIYSTLEKALQKPTETIEDQRRKQIDAIMNQNKRKVGLINNDGKKLPQKIEKIERFEREI